MSHHKNKLPACANCGHEFNGPDNFCPECGQENHDIRLPLKHHLHEVVEGLLHFDSKSFRTFLTLIIKPGLLSREFNSGKRVRYVPPVRMYIFISFLFFFLLSTGKIIKDKEEEKKKQESKVALTFLSSTLEERITEQERGTLTPNQIDSLTKFRSQVSIDEVKGLSNEEIDSLIVAKQATLNSSNRYLFRQLAKATGDGGEHLFKLIQKNLSYGMFLLMPFIGLLFFLFYRKQSGYYIESLVIAIHYHCVIFIIFSAAILIDKFFPFWYGYAAGILIVPVYLYFMLKKYFGQKRSTTLAKTLAIGTLHFFSVLIFYVAVMFISFTLL